MSFINNVDKERVETLLNETEANVVYFTQVTNEIVKSQSQQLDDLMKEIYYNIVTVENPAIETIEKYFLELSNCIYFINEKFERLGIYKAVAESAYNDVRAKAVQEEAADKGEDRKSRKTVAEITAIADSASMYEGTVADIYERACAIIKGKLNAAQTMVNTLSKIMSARMTEMQLSVTSSRNGTRQILNEDY